MNVQRPVNILMLGGAKRVSMARMFKEAAASMGLRAALYSYELTEREPIALEATVIAGLRWSDPMVDRHLREIVDRYSIDIVVPFVDGAVAVAARLRDAAFVPSADEDVVERMFNKVAAAEAFEAAGFPIPTTWRPGKAPTGLIAKPAFGSASQGLVLIDDADTLRHVLAAGKNKYLIQQRIDRREEYTVDCYADVATGSVLAAVPRLRIAVSGGEVTRTATVDNPELVRLSTEAIAAMGLRGAVTVQFIHDLDTDRVMVMEINPRLGGGAVCSVAAGANIPLLIIRQALGLDVEPVKWQPGVEIARYPAEIVFKHKL